MAHNNTADLSEGNIQAQMLGICETLGWVWLPGVHLVIFSTPMSLQSLFDKPELSYYPVLDMQKVLKMSSFKPGFAGGMYFRDSNNTRLLFNSLQSRRPLGFSQYLLCFLPHIISKEELTYRL